MGSCAGQRELQLVEWDLTIDPMLLPAQLIRANLSALFTGAALTAGITQSYDHHSSEQLGVGGKTRVKLQGISQKQKFPSILLLRTAISTGDGSTSLP